MKLLSMRIGLFLLMIACFYFNGYAQFGFITTYVGPRLPVNGDQATTVDIGKPLGVAEDGEGGFFFSSEYSIVYRVAEDGTVNIVAGKGTSGFSGDGGPATAAQLNSPKGLARDSAGNLYIADTSNHRIRMVTPGGTISTIAGTGTGGFSGDSGPATDAMLNSPSSVTLDSAGNLYIADTSNNRIRMVTPDGIISTIAGKGLATFSGDGGPATAAGLAGPTSVAIDSAGNIYIADTSNKRIRMVTPDGTISTIAGTGTSGFSGNGGPATAAKLNSPRDVAIDSAGNIYIADTGNNLIRKVTPDGIISTFAGNGGSGFSGDGGPATAATLYSPEKMSIDADGTIYIADYGNRRIRIVDSAGTIYSVAGMDTAGFSGDGGPATAATLYGPNAVAIDFDGNLYIADGNCRIRKVDSFDGTINTIGVCSAGRPAGTSVRTIGGIAVDSGGNIFFSEYEEIWENLSNLPEYSRIRKIAPTGIISTIAGTYTSGFSGDGGPATSAKLHFPAGLGVDTSGNLYIADARNNRIRKVTPDGTINTIAGTGASGFSGDDGPATAAMLYAPQAAVIDADGNLYIADIGNKRIRKVTPAGIISTVAGTGASGFSGDDGPATAAMLDHPIDVAIDADSNLYIADRYNHRIRKVTPAGMISTIAGTGIAGFSGENSPATAAALNYPQGVEVDSEGNIYIADTYNNRIRIISLVPPSVVTNVVKSITQASAIGGGEITLDGGSPVTARGVCWSTSANPTTLEICTNDGDGTGTFASAITGLAANTRYHVRAYGINDVGTAYGSDLSFTTASGPPDFILGTGSGGSLLASVTAGGSGVYNLALSGVNNFAGTVTLTCSGLPAGATCSISPASLNLSGSTAVPFTVTVKTTAKKTSAMKIKYAAGLLWSGPAPTAGALCLCSTVLLFSIQKRRRLSWAFIALSALGLVACGRSTTSSGTSTPAGTYSVVLTAKSGSTSHTASLTLMVK